MPHRVELWKSQERIKETGWEEWFNEMVNFLCSGFLLSSCGFCNLASFNKPAPAMEKKPSPCGSVSCAAHHRIGSA